MLSTFNRATLFAGAKASNQRFRTPSSFLSRSCIQLQHLSTTASSFSSVAPEVIIENCLALRSSVQQLNDKYKGPLDTSSQKNTILPFVFLLGNHSSGKSSFINYLCQRKIQTAGVAPTDDTFSIIVPGPADVDRDGPAFIGDPDMGFTGLRMFGPQLVHHTQLKVRSSIAIKNFMVIDTPGMIDSPRTRDHYLSSNGDSSGGVGTGAGGGGFSKYTGLPGRSSSGTTVVSDSSITDRGYDFEGVCRWYAEKADVILLFFDPDKPGTTGETLQVLTNSLVGLEHKLHIILNKADQFKKIHDFARAYGSLCWNLSKVIQRKDLPRIYTMCLPSSYRARGSEDMGYGSGDDDTLGFYGAGENDSERSTLGSGITDLEATREEVVAEVLNAPKRRVDNEITRLTDSVSLLQMHLEIVNDLTKQYRSATFRAHAFFALASTSAVGITAGAVLVGLPIQAAVGGGVLGTAACGGLLYWQTMQLKALSVELVSDAAMIRTFRKLYARRIAERDEFVTSLWPRVHDHLTLALTPADLTAMAKVKPSEFYQLKNLLDSEIPDIRRKAAPSFNRIM